MPAAIPSRRSLSAVLAGNLTTFFRVEGCMEAMFKLHLIYIYIYIQYITLSFSAFGFCCSLSRGCFFSSMCAFVRLWYHGKEVEAWVWGLWKHQEGDRCGHVMPCQPWTIRSWLHWNERKIQLFLWKWGSPILMLGISRSSFLINSTVPDFHGKLWECFGKLGIFGQVRMVYDQKGKPRGCGKGWLMLWRKSPVS